MLAVYSGGGGVVQPDGWVEHGQGDHGLVQEDALGDEPEDIVPRDRAVQPTPRGGGAVGATHEHTDAGERKDGQKGLGPGRQREVAAAVKGRVGGVLAVGAACSHVGHGQAHQGTGQAEALEEEAGEEDGLAGGGWRGEADAPVAGGAGPGEGHGQADALEEGGEEVVPDEDAEVGVGREGRVFCAEVGDDLGG